METSDYLIGIGGLVIFLALITGSLFGVYRLGRNQERKDLTRALESQIESITEDGIKLGQIQGYARAKKELHDSCDNIPMESGHY